MMDGSVISRYFFLTVIDDLRINLGLYQNHTRMQSISQSRIHTPNIDAMGKKGVVFDRVSSFKFEVMSVQQTYQTLS